MMKPSNMVKSLDWICKFNPEFLVRLDAKILLLKPTGSPIFTFLKRALSIVLLSMYLLSATQLGQLCKLPAFFTHYQEHQQHDPHLTLIEFFIIHYASDFVQDEDYKQDQKLPFKTIDNSLSYSLGAIVNQPIQWQCGHVLRFQIKHTCAFVDTGIPSSFIQTIWQPPRHA